LFLGQLLGLRLPVSRYESVNNVRGCAKVSEAEKKGVVELVSVPDNGVWFGFVRMAINACKLAYSKTPFTMRVLAASPTGEGISTFKGELSISVREEATSEKRERLLSLCLLGPESCLIIGLSTISVTGRLAGAGAVVREKAVLAHR
jgi:hypothetical protein